MAQLDHDSIPWKDLESLGVTKATLEKTKNLEALLNYGKTGLLSVRGRIAGLEITGGHVKLFMRKNASGTPELRMELVRKFPNLEAPVYGTALTEDQKRAILEGGTARVKCNTARGELNLFVSLDKDTNQLNQVNADRVSLPESIAGVNLTEEHKDMLLSGGKVRLQGMKKKNGQSFDAFVSYNAVSRGLVFLYDNEARKVQGNHEDMSEHKKKRKSIV